MYECFNHDIFYNEHIFQIGICGYDDKQQVLLDKIIDTMINFEVNPERFKVLKESVCII